MSFGNIAAAFAEVGHQATQDAHKAIEAIGQQIADDARSMAPTATGALADSITVSKKGSDVVIQAGDADAPYAAYVEYGAHRTERGDTPAQPFMRPAAAKAASSLEQVAGAYFKIGVGGAN